MIRKHRHRFSTGVVHSYTGSLEEVQQLLALDLYIGINGCSLKTQDNLAVVAQIPEERLMLETDAPWCDIRPTHASHSHLNSTTSGWAPVAFDSKKKERFVMGAMIKGRNEPCNIQQVLKVMASVRQVQPEHLASIVYRNTCRVFFPHEESA
ncbi:hypothetical protein H4R35_001974 [Dimargaris xerosporica]|nr:hypothetical protein H4R35_001974 [Dimargaris xerosporica]